MKTNPNDPITAGQFQITKKFEGGYSSGPEHCLGLTKREHFAVIAMQGILASQNSEYESPRDVSERSVRMAASLIRELNKDDKNG